MVGLTEDRIDVGRLPAASGRGGPHANLSKRSVRFNNKVVKHRIYESGHDNFTFNNVNRDGTPRVSQTQCKRNTNLPSVRKRVPEDTIWAHNRAVLLALEGKLINMPAARPISFKGRRPYFGRPYLDNLDLDDEYHVDENPNTADYVNVSYRPMAFWDGQSVYYKKFDLSSGKWVVRMTDVQIAQRWSRKRWHSFCHAGLVLPATTFGVNARGEAVNMAKHRPIIEWIVDSGAGVHLINTSTRRGSRFPIRPCQEFEIQGVGGCKICNKEAVIELDTMGIQIEAGITDSPYNLLSVELLRRSGVSFISSGCPSLPPFLLLPDGLHAIVLELQGDVPIWKQNDCTFLPEPVVLHDGLRVPASFAAKFAFAGIVDTCPSLTTNIDNREHQADMADTAGASADGESVSVVPDISGTSAGETGCHVHDVSVGGGPIRLVLNLQKAHSPGKRPI